MPVFIVLSAITYHITLRVRLAPDQVERYIADSRREAETEEEQLGAMP